MVSARPRRAQRLVSARQVEHTFVTSQGHPRTVFRRALERGNYLVAITTARECGRIDLNEALERSR